MTTSSTSQFEINGIIDTSRNVLENINTIANASGCFVTWDPSEGYWAVILNTTGAAVKNFNDSNIVGAINVQGSGINDMYNSVSISFPHLDLNDTRDVIELKIPDEDRFEQELDNRLEMQLDCINNPVQAQLIAARELKQSRVDKIITFTSNYTANGLKAGQLISVTSPMYGYVSKIFRITQIEESDDDGNITYNITALEYDADVYSTSGLIREERNKKTGIVPKAANVALTSIEQQGDANNLAGLINNPLAWLTLLNALGSKGVTATAGDFASASVALDETDVSTSDQAFFSAYTDDSYNYPLGITFTAPYSGVYLVNITYNCIVEHGVNGAGKFLIPEGGLRYKYALQVVKNGATITRNFALHQEYYGPPFGNANLGAGLSITANAGDTYVFSLNARNEFGPNHPDAGSIAGAKGRVQVYLRLNYRGAS